MEWRVRGIRGATTVSENSREAIALAVVELLDEIESRNQLKPEEIVSAIFSITNDLDAVFPAKIARERSHWDCVTMLDVQQMPVEGSLEKCIRVLLHVNSPLPQKSMAHVYLQGASNLRPDWNLTQVS